MADQEFDEAAFAMGEAVADMLASVGMDRAVVGGQVVAHARRHDPPAGPLTGFGDPVSPGDLVAQVLIEGSKRYKPELGILNQYDTNTGLFTRVRPLGHLYSVTSALLATSEWRREFTLVEPAPPDWQQDAYLNFADDAVVAALDARFARAGHPRPRSIIDRPVVAWPKTSSGVNHAVPAGMTRSCCQIRVPRAPATGPVFVAGAPDACRRCSAQVEAAIAVAEDATSVTGLSCVNGVVRNYLYVRCFRKQYYFSQDASEEERKRILR